MSNTENPETVEDDEPNRWESAGKFLNVPVLVPPYGTYRDTL